MTNLVTRKFFDDDSDGYVSVRSVDCGTPLDGGYVDLNISDGTDIASFYMPTMSVVDDKQEVAKDIEKLEAIIQACGMAQDELRKLEYCGEPLDLDLDETAEVQK